MLRAAVPLHDPPPALDAAARTALDALYSDLDRELPPGGADCRACGACCRLAEWGHELRATPLELALLVERHGARAPAVPGVCPYLDDGRCSARSGRLLGCRAFRCGLPATVVEDACARAFERLRALHAERGIPFEQGDLLASLEWMIERGRGARGAQVGNRPATSE
jgi:Fe-S-cluster containining protein